MAKISWRVIFHLLNCYDYLIFCAKIMAIVDDNIMLMFTLLVLFGNCFSVAYVQFFGDHLILL